MNRLVKGVHVAKSLRLTAWVPGASKTFFTLSKREVQNIFRVRCGAYTFASPCEAATAALARRLASELRPGDCYCLYGDVGAGKSVFSRAFIRAAFGEDDLAVPSPTYLLQNVYDDYDGPPIHHYDLYRLETPESLRRLELDESYRTAVSLIEWAERLGPLTPPHHLAVDIRLMTPDEEAHCSLIVPGDPREDGVAEEEVCVFEDRRWRRIALTPHGDDWEDRLQKLFAADGLLSTQDGEPQFLIRLP